MMFRLAGSGWMVGAACALVLTGAGTALLGCSKQVPAVAATSTSGTSVAASSVAAGGGGMPLVLSFAAPVGYSIGDYPYSMTAGDWNGDKKLDLAVAIGDSTNTIYSNVSILLGNGDGTFQRKVAYGAGGTPKSMTAGDWNGDGKLDLATANIVGNNVSILLGNGDGTFQAAVEYAAGKRARSVTAGDWNGDGKPDLVVANNDYGNISILLGNGDGTFQAAVEYAAGVGPTSVTAGDWNGDKKLDLAVANRDSNNVSILLGKGDGTFQPKVDYDAGEYPPLVTAGDWNGDGKLDLVVANGNRGQVSYGNTVINNVSILLGKGDGTFQAKVDYDVDSGPNSMTAGDWNGDGKLDLVVARDGHRDVGNNVSILLGNGDGTFQRKVDYAVGKSPWSVTAGDWNGDGKPDLALANYENYVSILLNTSR